MKIFCDAFSGEEIISDSFGINELFSGAGGEVEATWQVVGGETFDIGAGNHFGGGGDDEKVDDKAEKILDVIAAFRYQETAFNKSDYQTYIKGYMKKIKEYLEKSNPDRVKPFMTSAAEMVKWIMKNFDEFQFYCPESYDMDNIIILAYYKEGKETPTFIYFMDGMKAKLV